MTEVRPTPYACILPVGNRASFWRVAYPILRDWFPEAWPAGAAVELGLARKQRLITDDAVVGAIVGGLVKLVVEGGFGSPELGHSILLKGQPRQQLLSGELFLRRHGQLNQ